MGFSGDILDGYDSATRIQRSAFTGDKVGRRIFAKVEHTWSQRDVSGRRQLRRLEKD